jgi:hypothetical protein
MPIMDGWQVLFGTHIFLPGLIACFSIPRPLWVGIADREIWRSGGVLSHSPLWSNCPALPDQVCDSEIVVLRAAGD